MTNINIISLFPHVFEPFFELIPYKNLLKEDNLNINLINLRDFGIGNYKKVDDTPYGGGPGMVLMIEPIYNALNSIENKSSYKILLSPRGKRFVQQKSLELSQKQDLTFICGRYEGVDARVEQLCDEVISIGDFVLSGGEIAALAVMETMLRHKEGALGTSESLNEESFIEDGQIEYPQYTRPEEFNGMNVPKEILSGNHELIKKWRATHAN